MSLKTYFEYKLYSLLYEIKNFNLPMFLSRFLFLLYVFVIFGLIIGYYQWSFTVFFIMGLTLFYHIYLDYRDGHHVGWKRKRFKERVLNGVGKKS